MEEAVKPILCIICLNVKNDEDCAVMEQSVRNALKVLLLKLPAKETNKSIICNTCCTRVFDAFRFKAICTDTEERIVQFNSENGAPVDLKEIYLIRKGKEQSTSVSEAERICRLCLQIGTTDYTPVKDIKIDIMCVFIPEVNFNYTVEPVLCTTCLVSLKKHCGFLRDCVDVQKFENVSEDEPMTDQFHIKTEEIEIKSEEITEDTEIHLPTKEAVVWKIIEKDSTKTQLFEIESHKCEMCDYQSKIKGNLIRHQLKHKKFSEVRTYICHACTYITKRKQHLVIHQLKHKDISEVQMYKCDICTYETKNKSNLVKHQLIHKDISEVQMYQCDTCSFESKHKGNLVIHRLMHKDVSEVKMYRCDMCNYETKYKRHLTKHQLIHKDVSEVQMYKCDICTFESKRKRNLVIHQLMHKDNTELKMYKCDICSYETKNKWHLVNHQRIHKDISEVKMYKCDACNFKSKHKNSLKRHASRRKHGCAIKKDIR